MTPRILLLGKNGQIGGELAELLPSIGETVALGREQLDVADPSAIRATVRRMRPNLIVNATGYTAVDKAESNQEAARAINERCPRVLAEEAVAIGAGLVHYSTDYVFDGVKQTPYLEGDAPNPINVYGDTKLAGEEAIRASGVAHLILRTSWVYHTRGQNFLLSILKLASQRDELRIVRDQVGAPTWARGIARATRDVFGSLSTPNGAIDLDRVSGTYHMTAAGSTCWYGFAQTILEQIHAAPQDLAWVAAATAGRPVGKPRLTPISTAEYPTLARRPAYSVLSNEKLRATFGVSLPPWDAQLGAVFHAA